MAGKPQQKPATVLDHCVKTLSGSDGAMKATDIITAVLKKVTLKGKTPNTTVAKILSVEAAKDNGKIVRLGHGLYDLRERALASGELTAEPVESGQVDDGEEPLSPIAGAVVVKDGRDVKPDPKPQSKRRSGRKPAAATA